MSGLSQDRALPQAVPRGRPAADGLSPVARHHQMDAVWGAPRGWRSLSSVNHTTIGLRFIATALVFFLIGGVLAMLIRAQLAASGNDFLDAHTYNQIFTMHGTVMMFLFAIPMLEGFALYLLPKILGSRDLAYPRLGAYAYWCYLFGGLILIGAMVMGVAPHQGWFMYTPLSGATYSPGINADVWLIGVTFSEISAVCGGIELMATILRRRAPGMSLLRMPLFAWYILVAAAMIVVGFPPLILGSILLEVERSFGWAFFDVARGGDSLLWQHLFWMFGHPEVYIIFLPAAGMVSMMIPTFAGRPMVGHVWVVASVLAMGVLSFGLWVHHMFTVGIPQLAQMFFSAASMLVAIPTAVQFFAWIATLWAGKPVMRLPMLYLFGFLTVFVCGGLTGVMLALVPFNWQVHDTHFVVAHLHYVLVGGMVFPLLAAVYYWMPHVTGRMPSETLGKWAFWLIFIGFNLTFLVMHLTGLLGMPRRVYTYPGDVGWDVFNLASSIGGFIQAIGFALFLLDVVLHGRMGKIAPTNPWGAGSLEWAMPTPTPTYNIASLPEVRSREPVWDEPELGAQLAAGDGDLPSAEHGIRQTIAVEPLSGQRSSVIELPGSSWMPLLASVTTAVFFLALLFKQYLWVPVGGGLSLAIFLFWAWQTGKRHDPSPIRLRPDDTTVLPTHHVVTDDAPGWWGVTFALVADAMVLASLLFGYLFLWTVAPNWPPPQWITREFAAPLLAIAALLGAALLARQGHVGLRGKHPNEDRSGNGSAIWSWTSAVAGIMAFLALTYVLRQAVPDPRVHAYASIVSALVIYALIHIAIGIIMSVHVACRTHAGYVSSMRQLEPRILRRWWSFTAASGAVILAAIHFLPETLA